MEASTRRGRDGYSLLAGEGSSARVHAAARPRSSESHGTAVRPGAFLLRVAGGPRRDGVSFYELNWRTVFPSVIAGGLAVALTFSLTHSAARPDYRIPCNPKLPQTIFNLESDRAAQGQARPYSEARATP
jgi:hypothetical protein